MNAIVVRPPFSNQGRQFARKLHAVRAGVEAFAECSRHIRDLHWAQHGAVAACVDPLAPRGVSGA